MESLKIPDVESIRVARNENGKIVGGVSGSTYLPSLEYRSVVG
jgi:hypothetical protein